MKSTENALNWFEISVSDMARATKFYETVFEIEMPLMDMDGVNMAFFPTDDSTGKVGGALAKSNYHNPSSGGTIVYLNANPDLAEPLGRVEGAGGIVVLPKTFVNDAVGYMAMFIDSEGNKVAVHSRQG
jgi:predicted enzyme related to lactoylglutathione lyase